ncbi:putative reverse transcriptase/RNA-dependent DNA polymerase [Citrus sinensis]|uniref:Reverse transcriptase/RNA-dependent DNA polymerase n=1 Tax=Citrus sinensis TaxID=2711 RepID=A0ACB8K9I0_CITSI|nr:putative reverse transcriptase/RNA-dependent DNA polymerase [Citrus sinensis]
MIGRKKREFFHELKFKVLRKLSKWRGKVFSCGGKEILIKAAAQAVPSYAMSVFRLPATMCEDIQRRLCWQNKVGVCLIYGETLTSRVLKARYFRRCSFLDATIGNNPSFIWLSILWGRELLQRGIRWCVGSGQHIRIYGDNWVPMPLLFRPISPKNLGNEARVADLIENGNSWNMTLLRKYFLPPDIHSIMKIKLPSQSCNDRVIWYYDRCGEYTVKSGYHIARTWKNLDSAASSSVSSWQWATIWKLIAPSKVKIFLWRAFSGSLPSIENLELKRVVDDSRCRICGEAAQGIWDSCVRRNCRDITTMCTVQDVVIWEPPQLGWFKLNTDMAVDVQNGKVSYGAVIRNHEGLVMLAGTDFGNYCEDVAIAEAEAIRFGIRLAKFR